ncbi:hypothetical protein [Streptomyces sp. NPDC047869]|uniref:hypothetical protein n=1 Tax=Streptomyces sp. NPDC047869 TaxID=3154709 RepID=UPI00345640D0
MTEEKWGRPAAGREPAAAALLAWLADPDAPRLCLVTGGAGCGKSTLLAWLVGHGTRPGGRPERRVHGFVPLAGESALTATWTLAGQLLLAARTPGELVDALAADGRRTVLVLPDLHAADDPATVTELVLELLKLDHVRLVVEARDGSEPARGLPATRPAVLNLDEPRWTDPERYAVWAARRPAARPAGHEAGPQSPPVDLDDPAAVCAADPWQVSRRYERSGHGHGGLRAAWMRAGASLTHEGTSPAMRALVLLSALGDDADPRLPGGLAQLSGGTGWQVVWRRVRGDVRPPWPGPARALAAGPGELAGKTLVADHQGTVRLLNEADAAPAGRLPEPVRQPRALAAMPDGTALVLDALGAVRGLRAPSAPGPSGLTALLDDGPTPVERLLTAVAAQLPGPSTALSCAGGLLAVADGSGEVHALVQPDGEAEPRSHTAAPHRGAVTALAALRLPASETDAPGAPGVPLIYSGGADGTVRVWGPGADPLPSPVRSRSCPVTALAAGVTDSGPVLAIGWADGLVEHHHLDDGTVRAFRPGPPVHALAVTPTGLVHIGTDESLVTLRPVRDGVAGRPVTVVP